MLKGPKYKICRRVGGMVFPQCQSPRFTASLTKRSSKSKRRPKPKSEYGIQFLEKQKTKFTYGLTEGQFVNYIKKAQSSKNANPAGALCRLLETRLDNVIYRMGFASSRSFARQIVSHGHIFAGGKRINIPSGSLKVGDKITIRKESLQNAVFGDIKAKLKDFKFPKWIKFDIDNLVGEVIYLPELADGDQTLNFHMVTEFYSRT